METLELTRIESVRGTMPGGIGGIIRYSIDLVSNPDYTRYLGEMSVKQAMLLDINVLAGQGLEHGEFISSAIIRDCEYEPVMIAVGGTYTMEPDFNLLRRIDRWKNNSLPDEAVTREDFLETYGESFGGLFYERWVALDRNIEPMIDFWSDDTENGQDFLGMVMRRVYQYEKRIRERK